jgi:hypothetical protein
MSIFRNEERKEAMSQKNDMTTRLSHICKNASSRLKKQPG